MSRFSNFLENAIINATLRNGSAVQVAAAYLSLHTADPGETGASELANGNGYTQRALIAFDAPTDGVTQNTDAETFTASGGNWGPIRGFGIWDNQTIGAGNLLYHGMLVQERTINDGDTLNFAAGSITITLA